MTRERERGTDRQTHTHGQTHRQTKIDKKTVNDLICIFVVFLTNPTSGCQQSNGLLSELKWSCSFVGEALRMRSDKKPFTQRCRPFKMEMLIDLSPTQHDTKHCL